MAALEWLKANNPLYMSVYVNSSWEYDAAQDDSEVHFTVPHDSNCLFSAVLNQLMKYHIRLKQHTLREQLVDYFEDNAHARGDSTHLREFTAAPNDLSGPAGSSANTELADDEDHLMMMMMMRISC